MTIQYDGTNLHGWQIQKNARTVQGEIQNSMQKIFSDQRINLIGSGRTDSGVHALEQIANISFDTSMDISVLKNAINANIKSNDIYISKIEEVDSDFHSRFSATKREYVYKVSTKFSPIRRRYFWHVKNNIDYDKLSECASIPIGEHDFAKLSKKNIDIENTVCKVFTSKWMFSDDELYYIIIANRFLHHMVRYIVGVMIEISSNNSLNVNDFISMVECKMNGQLYRAPSNGLYLKKIYYE